MADLELEEAVDLTRANLFLNHGKAKHSSSCWRCDEPWPCLTMKAIIDADHEWAQWFEKWKAQVDTTASYASKLAAAEKERNDLADEKARECLVDCFGPLPKGKQHDPGVVSTIAALLRSVQAEGYLAGQRRMQERAAVVDVDPPFACCEHHDRKKAIFALEPEPMEEGK